MQQSVVITDDQTASMIQRGTAFNLTIFEAELHDPETGIYIPAKSITIIDRNGLIRLRDLLNQVDLEGR